MTKKQNRTWIKAKRTTAIALPMVVLLFGYTNCADFGAIPVATNAALDSTSGTGDNTPAPGDTTTPVPPVVTPPVTQNPPTTPSEGAGRVPVFVASGKVGRTIMSCDDGRTWIRDRSDDANVRCGTIDCDHHSGAAHGLRYGDGYFFANYGWGSPGSVRRSRDGFNWSVVATTTSGGGGLAYFPTGLLWVAFTNFSLSTNQGTTWTSLNTAVGYFLSRQVASAGNVVIVTGDSPTAAKISRDSGRTWADFTVAGVLLDGRNLQLVAGNGVITGVASRYLYDQATGTGVGDAYTIRSTDNGLTWTGQRVRTGTNYFFWATLLFDGTRFISWMDHRMWTSVDGLNWAMSAPVTIFDNTDLGAVARGPAGTFVSVPNNFGQQYTGQRGYRSMDGLTWTQLSTTAFPGGHPIIEIIPGFVDSAACQ